MKNSAPQLQGQSFEYYDAMLENLVKSALLQRIDINHAVNGFPTKFREFSIIRLKSSSVSEENGKTVIMIHDIEVLDQADGLVKRPSPDKPGRISTADNLSSALPPSSGSISSQSMAFNKPSNERSRNRAVNAIPVSGPCCVCETPGKFRCSHCKSHMYCSKTCQLVDWRTHQSNCDAILQTLQAEKKTFHLLDQCSVCERDVLSRIFGWAPMCQNCYVLQGVAYFSPEPNPEYLSCTDYFQYRKCQRTCLHCSNATLYVLRDEVLDEWLVCLACGRMKQLLRIWNPLTHRHVVSIDPPIVMHDENRIDQVSVECSLNALRMDF